MRKNQYLSNLLATTIICGAASIATPAFAANDSFQITATVTPHCAMEDVKDISFGALPINTTAGANAIRGCATEPTSTFFFDVDGLEIGTAFALIASNLSQLRLTQ